MQRSKQQPSKQAAEWVVASRRPRISRLLCLFVEERVRWWWSRRRGGEGNKNKKEKEDKKEQRGDMILLVLWLMEGEERKKEKGGGSRTTTPSVFHYGILHDAIRVMCNILLHRACNVGQIMTPWRLRGRTEYLSSVYEDHVQMVYETRTRKSIWSTEIKRMRTRVGVKIIDLGRRWWGSRAQVRDYNDLVNLMCEQRYEQICLRVARLLPSGGYSPLEFHWKDRASPEEAGEVGCEASYKDISTALIWTIRPGSWIHR